MSALAAAALLLAQAAAPPPAPEPDDTDPRLVFGWTAIGVGGAATLTGAVLGVVALARYESLSCENDLCPPEEHDDAQAFNDLRIPSGILTVGGILVAGIGIPFVVFANEDAKVDDGPRAELFVGPGQLGLKGRF